MSTAVCRACLGGAAGGHRLITIDDELELYERLTNTKLSTGRICNTLCYICYSHLQKFRKFSEMACKAETYLKVLQNNTEGSEITLTNLLKLSKIPASKLSVMTLNPIIMGGCGCIESKPIATKKVSEEKTHLVTDKVKIESTSKEVIKIKKEPTFIHKELVKKGTTKEIVKTELNDKELIKNEIFNSIKNNNLITEAEFIAELHKNEIDITIDKLQESTLNNIESKSLNVIFEDDMKVGEYVVVNASESLCYECGVCNKTFTTHRELTAHLITHKIKENPTIEETHKGTSRNTCPICKKTFTFSASLIPHLKTHIGEKPYICDVCGRSCRKKHNLQEHMKIHTGEKVFCKICNKGFTQTSSLGKHMYIHNGLTPYCCHICGRSFKQNSHMYVHIRHAHEGYKSHRCDICNKMLSGKHSWRQHMETHNPEKAYSCDKCLIKFSTAYSLQRHKNKYCRKGG